MRRRLLRCIAGGAFLFQGGFALAQNTVEALEQELKDAKQQHEDVTSQVMTNFFTQVDAAMSNPDTAVALYQQAGGSLPPPSPIISEHENETPTEREAREALDQANLAKMGTLLELHCGLMHFAALFVIQPDKKGLQDDWVAWLKSAAQVYPQLGASADDNGQKPGQHKKRRAKDDDDGVAAAPRQRPYSGDELKAKNMRDSIISKFLGFKIWGDKDPGQWSVKDLPRLFRVNVLDPSRTTPTAATLEAWDAYIAMANADEKDNDKWNQVVYPPMQFERACDDYAVAPGTDKLETLVGIIKANPTFPQVSDWITRVDKMLHDYGHGGSATTAVQTPAVPSSPASDGPNVSITTTQQGDMTVITTHTNSVLVPTPALVPTPPPPDH